MNLKEISMDKEKTEPTAEECIEAGCVSHLRGHDAVVDLRAQYAERMAETNNQQA
jgi:hypothetical protein